MNTERATKHFKPASEPGTRSTHSDPKAPQSMRPGILALLASLAVASLFGLMAAPRVDLACQTKAVEEIEASGVLPDMGSLPLPDLIQDHGRNVMKGREELRACYNTAHNAVARGDASAGITLFSKCLILARALGSEGVPALAHMLQRLANLEAKMNQLERAEEHLRQAMSIGGQDIDRLTQLVHLQIRREKYAEARTLLDGARAEYPYEHIAKIDSMRARIIGHLNRVSAPVARVAATHAEGSGKRRPEIPTKSEKIPKPQNTTVVEETKGSDKQKQVTAPGAEPNAKSDCIMKYVEGIGKVPECSSGTD